MAGHCDEIGTLFACLPLWTPLNASPKPDCSRLAQTACRISSFVAHLLCSSWQAVCGRSSLSGYLRAPVLLPYVPSSSSFSRDESRSCGESRSSSCCVAI